MRASGVLLPVSSLSSKYGIGCFSKEAYQFVDFLRRTGRATGRFCPLDRRVMEIRHISRFQRLPAIRILSVSKS